MSNFIETVFILEDQPSQEWSRRAIDRLNGKAFPPYILARDIDVLVGSWCMRDVTIQTKAVGKVSV